MTHDPQDDYPISEEEIEALIQRQLDAHRDDLAEVHPLSAEVQNARSPEDLAHLVREIVGDVLADIEDRRRRVAAGLPPKEIEELHRFPLSRFQVLSAVFGAVVVGVALLFWLLRPEYVDVPREMLGTWRTTDPVYADRGFHVTAETITIYTAADDSTHHPITRVTRSPAGLATLYQIGYEWYGDEYEFPAFLTLVPRHTIRLRNQQEIVWQPESTLAPAIAPDTLAPSDSLQQ